MVVAGYNMIRGIFADSAKVFHYDEAYNLTQEEVTLTTAGSTQKLFPLRSPSPAPLKAPWGRGQSYTWNF